MHGADTLMTSLAAYEAFLGLVVMERLVELVLSRRHARVLLARGGVEYGASHYRSMVLLHTAFLIGCMVEPWLLHRPIVPALAVAMVATALTAQAIRWWAISTLGVHWNTRVIVLPRAPRIQGGPYKWLSHPNYVAVVLEGMALPLIHSAWLTAMTFSVLNAWLLTVRIRTENAALLTMTSGPTFEGASSQSSAE